MLLVATMVLITHPHITLDRELKGGIIVFIFIRSETNQRATHGLTASNSDEKLTEKELSSRRGDDILQR